MLCALAEKWYGLSQSAVVELLVRTAYSEWAPHADEKGDSHENPATPH